jgi:molybdopterin-guanine dinucleotide biosynthesis protein A
MDFDAVILAGGSGRRLGGVDKGALLVGGRALLDGVLRASAAARRTVVVGAPRPAVRAVEWAREEPPGGGPLAGLAAGLAALGEGPADQLASALGGQAAPPSRLPSSPIVLVLATDLPWLAARDVDRLVAALAARPDADAALFADAEGHRQALAAAYRAGPLRAAVRAAGPVAGRPVRLVPEALAVVAVPDCGAAADCDTPEQLAAARAAIDGEG